MVLEKIKEFLAAQLDVSEDSIDENTNIIEDLCADSLDVVELIMTCEEEFGVTITETDAKAFKTVGDIKKYVEANM